MVEQTKHHMVEWRIDVEATHHSAAAVEALRIMRRPKRIGFGDAVCFVVHQEDGPVEESVDLDEIPNQPDLVALFADPAEYADPLPREALRIIAWAAADQLADLSSGLEDGTYEKNGQNEERMSDIERALRYVPESLRAPGEVVREPRLLLDEDDWKIAAALIGIYASDHFKGAHAREDLETIGREAGGLSAERVLEYLRKVFAPILDADGKVPTHLLPLYLQEFPDFDWQPPVDWLLKHDFVDSSWHNDVCPSWQCDVFVLWLDYGDALKREFPEAPRFSIHDEGRVVLATDEWLEVRQFVEKGKRDFGDDWTSASRAGLHRNLEAARKHLRRVMLNQVGVEEDEADESARLVEERLWDAGVTGLLEMCDRLYGEAYPYEDM